MHKDMYFPKEFMKRITFTAVLLCLLACSLHSPCVASSAKQPKIFILDSYHHGYEWSASELEGLLSRLREVYPTLDPIVEHLDAKRRTEEDSTNLMRSLIKEKYADEKFDMVVALDNPALNLLLNHRDELFKDIPLVFGGINDFDFQMLESHENVTGVAQITDVGQTIETALKLHPDTSKILVLHDYTSTGLAMRRELEKLAPNFSNKVKIIFSNPMTFEEAIDEMRSIPNDSLALILTFVTDRHGKTTSLDQSIKTLTSATDRPVYSTHFNAMGHGVVGGSVVGGREHGRRVADMILRILDGEDIDKIPVDMSGDSEHIFDYRQLERFGIPIRSLPAGSKIINRPLSFYEQHKNLTIGTLSGAFVLISFTVVLLVSFVKLRKSHTQLQGVRNSLSVSLRELEKSERFLEQIVENIPDMIFVKDVDNLRFVRFNKAGEELLGYSREELLGKNDYDFFSKDQAEFFISKDREVISKKDVARIEHEEISTKNRGRRILRTKKLLVLDSNGEPQFLLGISTDITEQKIAEDELKSSYIRLHQVFESITGLIIIIDSKTYEIVYANKFSEELYGRKLEGEICYETLNHMGLPCNKCSMKKVIELNGLPFQREYFNPVLKRHLLITERIIRWPDGRDVKFQFAMDTTDFRQSEHEKQQLQSQLLQAQKMEAVGTLAGGIAHDFNNLLQVVLGYSEVILARKNETDIDYRDVQKIRLAGKRGADLINSLLTFSRKVEAKHVMVNLNSQITSLGSLLSRTIPKDIQIDLRLSADLNLILADPTQIDQILMNLALNARDAMPHGGTLTVETANVKLDDDYCNHNLEAKKGEYVRMVICDTGHGMSEETLDHIFEPFFSTKEVGKGTGLGLATVYGVVKQLGGHIHCESRLHQGTSFSIFFPSASVTQHEQTEAPTDHPLGGHETILLVDDEEEIRNLGVRILQENGYEIIQAANGVEALDFFRKQKHSISLVLLDLVMPEMDGVKCSRQILSINPDAKILIASGFSVDVDVKNFLEKATVGIVQKPYGSKELLTAVRSAIDQDRSRE